MIIKHPNSTKTLFLLLSSFLITVSCSKFDDINTNPEESENVTASLMATQVIYNIVDVSGTSKVFSYDYLRGKYLGWAESALDEQYNYFGRSSFGGYEILTTAKKMKEQAVEEDNPQKHSYKGLFRFLKAYKAYGMTMRMGDIPYSESLNEEHQKPKYDIQKEVFAEILDDLDKAYSEFETAGSQSFEGDIIYDGDNTKWQKMISAFELKVLISLSKKEDNSDLKIKKRFKDIVKNKKLFESNADNFQIEFENQSGMLNPFHKSNDSHYNYALMSSFFIDMMKKNKDYRMFYYAAPATHFVEEGTPKDSWDAFEGVDITLSFNEMGAIASNQEVSRLNKRYIEEEQGEPFGLIRYSDVNFYLAEAALRGWISGDPNDYYLEGIAADMKFEEKYMINDENYHYGRIITDNYISDFIDKPSLQLNGDFDTKLKQILDQKYISNFLQVQNLDAYFDYRRTGYPELPFNPKTNQNTQTDQLPLRFMYPNSESGYNTDNLQEALDRQFEGNDDVNKKMWLLK